jgi:tRNA threonylcarbamoyladenosine biosynthesis protein TsaB
MTRILSIETSTAVCSVAVHNDDQLLGYAESRRQKSHSSLLVSMIDQVLGNAKVSKSDLSAIAVSKGPGSYTGLRIGTSTAKGLCYALEIPLIGIDTLKSMALEASRHLSEPTYIIPMLDARRAEVYCGIFDEQMQMISEPAAVVLDDSSFVDLDQTNRIIVIGDGAIKAEGLMGPRTHTYYWSDVLPSAKFIGELAVKSYRCSEFVDLAYFEPFYLKEFYTPKPPKKLA